MSRPNLKRDLGWGETPWDDWSRDQLLVELARHHIALRAAVCPMATAARWAGGEYWSAGGVGGDALSVVKITLGEFMHDDQLSESIYRSLSRYAVDLLFGPGLGAGWHICDADGTMLGRDGGQPGPTCIKCGCEMRPIEPRDLGPFGKAMTAGSDDWLR